MSVKRFKFVSPGIFVNEIDNSFLPREPQLTGPAIITRALRGPAMRPVTVGSQAEFVETFGEPVPGGRANDVWRDGNMQSPMYGTYAAMAYLKNSGPVTVVRLLGHEHEEAQTAGKAGWTVDGDAWGLWLFDSSSVNGGAEGLTTGSLAAIFYTKNGYVPALSGNMGTNLETLIATASTGGLVESVGNNREFKILITNSATAATSAHSTTFNFNKRSSKFIRKVFNTNPTLLNTSTISAANQEQYFLGQTFENALDDALVSSSAGDVYGMILRHAEGNTGTKAGKYYNTLGGAQTAKTGWIFSQHLSTVHADFAPAISSADVVSGGVTRLFRIHALNSGEWESKNLKVSIADIKYSRNPDEDPYGTFTVQVRRALDSDVSPQVVESYANCNLNPNSPNYIARKIGDQVLSWNEADRRYTYQGDYDNQSRFIRVEVDADVEAAAVDPSLLPFGFFGPPVLKTIATTTNANGTGSFTQNEDFADIESTTVASACAGQSAEAYFNVGPFASLTMQFKFPTVPTRASSTSGSLSNRKQAYWGAYTLEPGSSKVMNASWGDLMFPLPDGLTPSDTGLVDASQWVFSLDDVKLTGASYGTAEWAEGHRAAGNSWSASGSDGNGASWSGSLDQGLDRFTMPLWGGFDGLDIQDLDPFASEQAMEASSTDKTDYAYYSVRKAIDTVSDPEETEINLAAMPGIDHSALNTHLVNVCERRGDALAVLDIGGGYKPRANRAGTTAAQSYDSYGGSVDNTLDTIEEMNINSSYACCYYPWVQIQDQANSAALWVPPSVAALGTFASSEAKSDVWFAPAGFTRGGLTEGSAGIPVTGVRDRLTAKDRDKLYAANVNPIASFPAEGIVIFGQKTMQVQASALDRINVRRLMIYVKKEISKMAATTIFEPNVQRTWDGFTGRVNPFLKAVKAGLGLSDFKVVLDETTTTEDLIDRNIMYAKILLKPTRAIEYIAIDFVITNSGASFED